MIAPVFTGVKAAGGCRRRTQGGRGEEKGGKLHFDEIDLRLMRLILLGE